MPESLVVGGPTMAPKVNDGNEDKTGEHVSQDAPLVLPVSSATGDESVRLEQLCSHFESHFGQGPSFVARVPGRVNLIGEHVDYCGYPVFPVAIQQDVLLATSIRPNDSRPQLQITNVDSNYHEYTGPASGFSIDKNEPHWYNYILCGLKGTEEEMLQGKDCRTTSICMAVDGNVPPSAGLSSSSAVVCAGALALSYAHGVIASKLELASLCARAERHIGTEGGGMDQAVAFLAEDGQAQLINFGPLKAQPVQLPSGAALVVGHSLVRANKAATHHYNTRVSECRLATQLLALKHGLNWRQVRIPATLHESLGRTLPEMVAIAKDGLHSDPYSKEEICKILDVTEEELDVESLSENTRHLHTFHLQQRILHVFEEALRVDEFKTCCEGSGELLRLGRLMNESHNSLRDLYECSHPQLDRLVDIAQKKAYGARLTGAGWGGCMVAMVDVEKVQEFMDEIREEFYSKLPPTEGEGEGKTEHLLFPTRPGPGACVYRC